MSSAQEGPDLAGEAAASSARVVKQRPKGAEGKQRWLSPGVVGIGAASFLADVGHEIPTALLPSLLTSLGAPAAVLGAIEGVADGLAGMARLAGGAMSDDPARRRAVAVGGYSSTAVLSSVIGASTAVWQVGVLRGGAWAARGLRVPARNALLADIAAPEAYGRAYGFERAMDNLGAIGGPLLALFLVSLVGVRRAIGLSVIPGLLAALAIIYAIRQTPKAERRERQRIRLAVRPVLSGSMGRLMVAIAAFEFGNVAVTLFILRASQLLQPGRSRTSALQLALGLYVAYNVAATLVSVPAGRIGDRKGSAMVLTAGIVLFGAAYVGFALGGSTVIALAPAFLLAGVAIGCVETSQNASVAAVAQAELRGSAFGVFAGIQSFGNLAASAVAGILWTAVSPAAAFAYLAVWMAIALAALLRLRSRSRSR
jgi:MFS family permease